MTTKTVFSALTLLLGAGLVTITGCGGGSSDVGAGGTSGTTTGSSAQGGGSGTGSANGGGGSGAGATSSSGPTASSTGGGSSTGTAAGGGGAGAGTGGATASSATTTVTSSVATGGGPLCGNGALDPGEECDDGANGNLDGCDAACGFEQVTRANSIKLQFNTDAICKNNRLGSAIGQAAQGQLQTPLDSGVADGSITLMTAFLGLTDLTGQNQASGLQLGGVDATVVAGAGYDGTKDQDWWYASNPTSLDSNRVPLALLSSTLANGKLVAQGTLDLPLSLGGAPAILHVSGTHIEAAVSGLSTPTASAGGTPGHLAAEHLAAGLQSFDTLSNGELCGNVSAASLAAVPIPSALTTGNTKCTQGYTANNSLLDVIVGGCTVFIIAAINPTQPDQTDPGAPDAGAGGPYKLSAGGNHQVSTCKDKSNATVPLQTCLNDAAYSMFLKFTMDRVIAK